jgi:hypothetical protein
MTVFQEGFRLAGFAEWKQLVEACNKQRADVEIICVVILLQTPNLVSLRIGYGTEQATSNASKSAWISLLEHTTSISASHCTPNFRHLLSMNSTRNSWAIGKIPFAFRLPSLRQLNIGPILLADDSEERGADVLRQLLPLISVSSQDNILYKCIECSSKDNSKYICTMIISDSFITLCYNLPFSHH